MRILKKGGVKLFSPHLLPQKPPTSLREPPLAATPSLHCALLLSFFAFPFILHKKWLQRSFSLSMQGRMPREKDPVRPHKRIYNLTDAGFEARSTNATALKRSRVGLSLRRDRSSWERENTLSSRRQWAQLVGPMAKYDPEIVMEFYVNAWPMEEGVKDKRS